MENIIKIFHDAFGSKFMPFLGSEQDVKTFIKLGLDKDYLFAAFSGPWVVGVLGFQIKDTRLFDLDYRKLRKEFNIFKTLIILLVYLLFFNKKTEDGTLRIEAIAVHPGYRGKGIGSFMLEEIERFALKKGLLKLSLEVIDTNPRAKRLYERLGFVREKTIKHHFLTRSAGFSSEDIMVKHLRI